MANNGDGTYNNPIVVDGLIKKNGKIYKLNTGNTKNCVKSVNNIKPDDNGNVVVPELDKTDIENSITEIKKKNAEQDTALSQAKQELSDKCDTTLSTAKTYADGKANDVLTNAKAYTDNNFFKCNGTSPLTQSPNFAGASQIYLDRDDSCLRLYGGTASGGGDHEVGAMLILNGKDRKIPDNTALVLRSNALQNDGSYKIYDLRITTSGELTFGGRNIVRTVGNCLADANGNCDVGVITASVTSSTVNAHRFSNGLKIQSVRISGNQGQSFGTVNWPIPFSDTSYHVFATSEDPDENLAFQHANVSYLNKTVTSCRVGHYVIGDSMFYIGGWIDVLAIGV